jgi:hypothetical protein
MYGCEGVEGSFVKTRGLIEKSNVLESPTKCGIYLSIGTALHPRRSGILNHRSRGENKSNFAKDKNGYEQNFSHLVNQKFSLNMWHVFINFFSLFGGIDDLKLGPVSVS